MTRSADWFRNSRLLTFLGICFAVIFSILYLYYALLIPICLALFFTYLLLPVVDLLHRRFKLSRTLAAGIIVVGITAIVAVIVTFLLPLVYHEVIAIAGLAPKAIEFVTSVWVPLIKQLTDSLPFVRPEEIDAAVQEFKSSAQLGATMGVAIGHVWSATPTFVAAAVNLVLLPIVSFFLLRDTHDIMASFRDLVPPDLVKPLHKVRLQLDETIRVLLRGQVIVAFTLGVLYILGLSVAGMSYALAIGAVAGICRLVPYLDVIVGLTLSSVVIVSNFTSWWQFFWVGLVFLLVQTVDGMFITPRVIGMRAGLHPGLVIVSVIALGHLFGFYGVLLAVPAIAIAKVFGRLVLDAYRSSPWFNAASNHQNKI